MPEITKINVGGTSYDVKDTTTAAAVGALSERVTVLENQETSSGVGALYVNSDGTYCGEVFNTYINGTGVNNRATGFFSHAEGFQTKAEGYASHAEGRETTASDTQAHAEGTKTTASGMSSHAEGAQTTASGLCSHSEGNNTTASGNYSHAEGSYTVASGINSHAQNARTIAASACQTAMGMHNVEDKNDKYALIIGNGSSDSKRSNALAIDWNGNIYQNGEETGHNLAKMQAAIDTLSSGSGYDDSEIKADITALQDNKVDKVDGKALSTNDYTTDEKTKLAGLENYDDSKVRRDIAYHNSSIGLRKKNMLDVTSTTETKNGITFTVNSDKSVTVSGKNDASYTITYMLTSELHKTGQYVRGKQYKMTGCPANATSSDGSKLAWWNVATVSTTIMSDHGDGATFDCSYTSSPVTASICIAGGADFTDNPITFYPMLRDADITDDTYEAYTPDLQTQIKALSNYDDTEIRGDIAELQGSAVGKAYYFDGSKKGEVFNNYTGNTASGVYSHAEGSNTTASGYYSHAECADTKASGSKSHAEGSSTIASGTASHAEGARAKASGDYSHAEGSDTIASKDNAHAQGLATIAASKNQMAMGKYNVEDANDKYALIIGNGSSDSARSNAFAIDWNGNIYQNNESTGHNLAEMLEMIQANTTNIGNKVDAADGYSLVADTEIERLAGLSNYDDTQVKNDVALNISSVGLSRKNLLKHNVSSQIKNEVTVSVNSDKSITLSGTSTNGNLNIQLMRLTNNGSYTLTGCPSGGGYQKYGITLAFQRVSGSVLYKADIGDGYSFVFDSSEYSYVDMYIEVKNGITVDNATFYPMLRYSDIIDDTYEPYTNDLQTQITSARTKLDAAVQRCRAGSTSTYGWFKISSITVSSTDVNNGITIGTTLSIDKILNTGAPTSRSNMSISVRIAGSTVIITNECTSRFNKGDNKNLYTAFIPNHLAVVYNKTERTLEIYIFSPGSMFFYNVTASNSFSGHNPNTYIYPLHAGVLTDASLPSGDDIIVVRGVDSTIAKYDSNGNIISDKINDLQNQINDILARLTAGEL